MTKAAALAILAFTSSTMAYYPSEYDNALYARDAYAYPDPEEYDLYSREAEPEFDIHPRDAYMEGYYDGLYSRGVDEQQKPHDVQSQKPKPQPLSKSQPTKGKDSLDNPLPSRKSLMMPGPKRRQRKIWLPKTKHSGRR